VGPEGLVGDVFAIPGVCGWVRLVDRRWLRWGGGDGVGVGVGVGVGAGAGLGRERRGPGWLGRADGVLWTGNVL